MDNYYYDHMARYMTDDELDTDSLDSETDHSSEVEYHFDGFTVELNAKIALTPINIKLQK